MSFHDLHHQGVPFVLPNAWDVPSALAYLADGFTAIGTTSFGVSSSRGHPDGGRATRDSNIALAAALASWLVEQGNDALVLTGSTPIVSKTAPMAASLTPHWRPPKWLLSNGVIPTCSSTLGSTLTG